jgi:hypothetical protein
MAAWLEKGLPSAGLYAGPAAWFVSTQANYSLVPWVCAHKIPVIPFLAAVLVVVCLFGGFLSWRAFAVAGSIPRPDTTGAGRPHRFVAALGIMMAVLFALVIAVQGVAGVVFDGCER